jgi:hypothetical protein
MITEKEIDQIRIIVAGAGKIDETRPQFELLQQLAREHAAMREALRYREQSKEPAPPSVKVLCQLPGSDAMLLTLGYNLRDTTSHWLPIPPLNKEQP